MRRGKGKKEQIWSNASAFDLRLALREAQHWIEAVTGSMFPTNDFHQAMKDGVLLCRLANKIKPGCVPRIQEVHSDGPRLPERDKRYSVAFDNAANSASKFAEIDNISSFIRACKEFGLKETLLFTAMDLHDGTTYGLRAVAVTLYWVGRVAASAGFAGPKLNLSVFTNLTCSLCKNPIIGDEYVVTLEKQYHVQCSKCGDCGKSLTEVPKFALINGVPICSECKPDGVSDDGVVKLSAADKVAIRKQEEAEQRAQEEEERKREAEKRASERSQKASIQQKIKESEERAKQERKERRERLERLQREKEAKKARLEKEKEEAERKKAEEAADEKARKERELQEEKERERAAAEAAALAAREAEEAAKRAEEEARKAEVARKEAEEKQLAEKKRAEDEAEARRNRKEEEELTRKREQERKDAERKEAEKKAQEEEEKRQKERQAQEEGDKSRKSPTEEKKSKSSRKASNAESKKVTKTRKATDAGESPKPKKKQAKKKRKRSDARGSKKEKDAIDAQEGKDSVEIREKERELKEREREVREKEKELEMLLELAKKEEQQLEKKKEEPQPPTISISATSFYPNREGTMFVSQKQGPKAKWKKHHVELVESRLRIYTHRGGKEIRSLPPGSVNVAGLVQTKSKKRSSYLILSSSPSLMLATASNDVDELKEWSSAIMKSTRLYQARSKRIINQTNKRMSEGFSKEIQLAFSENNTAQRLYLQPQKSQCDLCDKYAPTWTTGVQGSQRQLCLQCHETRQVQESARKMSVSGRKAAKPAKKKKFGTLKSAALMTLAERKEDDTKTKQQLQQKFRRMQIEKRQDAILGRSIEESDNSATNSSNSRIVARVRNSYSIRQLLTNMEANEGSDTDDDFDMTFEDDSEGSDCEDAVPGISISVDFEAYETADGQGAAFSFEDLARAYGGVDLNSQQRASSDSLHTEGGFLSPQSARNSRFSVSSFSEISCRSSVSSSSKFSLDDDEDDGADGRGRGGNNVGDWNGRFQSIMQELATHSPNTPESEQISANLALLGLAHDFLYSATAYGKIIISEVYLPDSEKTIKPVNMGGVAGGSKYIVHNILFKFALDTEGLYGNNDAAAAKVGGHELKGMQSHFHCNIPHLHLPLMALVDYRGFRVLAISLLPINNSTIVYGTNDGGNTMFNKDRAMDKMMRRAAEILNLQQHKAGLNPANQETIYSAADIEGHLGTDHRRYLVDFSRTFPPEKPSSGIKGCNLSRLLRPEFVKRNPTPLCSDAYSNFLNKQELAAANREIDEATEYLRGPLISMFVPILADLVEPHMDDVGSFRLTEAVHRQGINMRHLGRLFVAITEEAVPELVKRETCRALVMVEMLARCIKQDLRTRLRNRMKQKKLPLEEPYRKLVLDYLNLVFGNSALSDEYWDTKIIVSVQRHFPGMKKDDLRAWVLATEKKLNTVQVEKKMVMYLEQEEAKSGKKGKGKNQEMQRAAAAAAAAAAVTGSSPSGAPHLLSQSVKCRESVSVFKKVLSFFPNENEGMQVLLARVQSMMGLKFSPKCLAELDSHLALKLSVDKPFVRTDLDEIGERIKYMNIMAQVEGYLLLVKGWQTRSQDSDSAMCYYDMAIKKFEEVLNSNTNSKVTLRNCAQALASQEEEACHSANRKLTRELPRLARANDYFQKAIEVDPTDPITYFQYATFMEQCECYDEAEDNYLFCLELDANFVEALHSYGNLLQLRGDFPAAERFFARVMQYSDTVSSSALKPGAVAL